MRLPLRVLMILASSFLFPALSFAGTISVTENQPMSFGMLAVPGSGSEYVQLTPNNDSLSGTGTMIGGSASRGIYLLKTSGVPDSSFVTIDIAAGTTGSPNLQLTHFAGNYDGTNIASFPAGSMPEPGMAGKLLYLGARASYNNLVGSGTVLNPFFDIMVIFE